MTHPPSLRRRWRLHPGQVIVAGFGTAVLIGTLLLMLPMSRSGDGSAPFLTALFHATSAVCVTGLVTVDTGTYWSGFGEGVILVLIQVGGFGIMTFATLLGLLIAHRMGLRTRITAAAETKSFGFGDVGSVLRGVLLITVTVEATVAVLLSVRLWLGYDESPGRALYLGVFHSISAFNNAGFGLYPDSLVRFVDDPWICLPIAISVILGGIGFPVILELRRQLAPRRWSLHTKMTLVTTGALLAAGTVFMTASEWNNAGTLGALDPPGRFLAGFFHAVMPRTAGFNSLDMAAMDDGTLFGTVILMFIGGGSAGTAGGIKVTTFVVLFFVIWAEVRGDRHVTAFDRRIDPRVARQALAVALLSVGAVVGSTLLMLHLTSLDLADALFEVTSAFATVGLSTGVTATLPDSALTLLVFLMFLGRLGPITLVSALALRERRQRFEYPEGRPIIG